MAFQNEVLDETKISTTHVEFRINGGTSSGVSPYNRIIGAIRNISAINIEQGFYKQLVHNADGATQVLANFKTSEGSGVVEFDMPEVFDIDGEVHLGDMRDVQLKGAYPKNSTKGWKYAAAKADVVAKTFTPKPGEPAMTRISIMPYNDAGTDPWTFDDNVTL